MEKSDQNEPLTDTLYVEPATVHGEPRPVFRYRDLPDGSLIGLHTRDGSAAGQIRFQGTTPLGRAGFEQKLVDIPQKDRRLLFFRNANGGDTAEYHDFCYFENGFSQANEPGQGPFQIVVTERRPGMATIDNFGFTFEAKRTLLRLETGPQVERIRVLNRCQKAIKLSLIRDAGGSNRQEVEIGLEAASSEARGFFIPAVGQERIELTALAFSASQPGGTVHAEIFVGGG